jgi:formylglycine-generating enzyme required for sulfatase activity
MNGTRPLLTLVAVSSWLIACSQGSAQNAAPDPAPVVEKRVALIVGIDEYTHLGPEGQLAGAASDADRMAKALASVNPPFEVSLLTNSDWKSTQEAFDQFLDRATGATCALIYFAGHGVEYHGENFLLVKDTDVSTISADVERMKRRLGTTSLSLQSWVDSLDETKAQVKVVILDCCRDNPLRVEAGSGTRSLVGGSQGLAQLSPPSGTLISYSADAGQRANDGLFTEVLTRHLLTPDMPLLQVFAATREEVSATSAQWAEEDEAKNLPDERRRVHHEPAEYTKLNLAGTRFAFMKGAPAIAAPPSMRPLKPLSELGVTPPPSSPLGMKDGQPLSGEELAQRMIAWKRAAEAMKPVSPSAPPAILDPATSLKSGFSLATAMEGRSAGEKRTILGLPMVWCPPGTFQMGAPDQEEKFMEDQKPFRATLTRGFWIAPFEVTQDQWEQVMGTSVRALIDPQGAAASQAVIEGSHPAGYVSWEDAAAWIATMNQQRPLPMGWRWALPTEAQWEYACRAGTTSPFSFGASLNGDLANCDGQYPYQSQAGPSLGRSTAVGSYPANPWGLHDMHGNVAEWVADWFGSYPVGEATDPTGPVQGKYRTLRAEAGPRARSAAGPPIAPTEASPSASRPSGSAPSS